VAAVGAVAPRTIEVVAPTVVEAVAAAVSFAGAIGEGVGAVASLAAACASGWRCRRRWCFPSLAAPLLKIGLGLGCRWGVWRHGKPRTASPGPHLFFIDLCDGGPPTM